MIDSIEIIVERISEALLLVDDSDNKTLTDIKNDLILIKKSENVSNEIISETDSAIKLLEKVIDKNLQFDSCYEQLCDLANTLNEFVCNKSQNKFISDTVNEPEAITDEFISSLYSSIEKLETKVLEMENGSDEAYDSIRRILHTMKGEFGILNLAVYSKLIHEVESGFDNNTVLPDNLIKLKDLIYTKLMKCSDNKMPPLTKDDFDSVFDIEEDNNIESTQTSVSKKDNIIKGSINVPVQRLDNLINLIGEAVIAQSMITDDPFIRNNASPSLLNKFAHADLAMRQIQEMSMALRMVSLKTLFHKMARLVRDMSKKASIKISLNMSGEETEIDKSAFAKIEDPVLHIIRNSIDHGVESQSERLKMGKQPCANIVLKAYQKAGNVYIEITDDGRGLDQEAILKKAIEMNYCKPDEKLTDQDIFKFIFYPGFSTAEKITDISGRGIGMNIVKKNIESLRGAVEIKSKQGSGTSIVMHFPLTLAIIDGMIVRVKSNLYIIPTLSIVKTKSLCSENTNTVLRKGEMISEHDTFIPLVCLGKLFGDENTDMVNSVAVIVEDNMGRKAGLVVNEILDKRQFVIKSLGNGFENMPFVSGGAILSDGMVSLILDVNSILADGLKIKLETVV